VSEVVHVSKDEYNNNILIQTNSPIVLYKGKAVPLYAMEALGGEEV
jgi:hypothetical protein